MQSVQASVVLFTVVFVLLTLLVNAPMLPWVLRWTGLSVVPQQHVKMRAKAVHLLAKHTEQILQELRDDEDEMLRGAAIVSLLSSRLQPSQAVIDWHTHTMLNAACFALNPSRNF